MAYFRSTHFLSCEFSFIIACFNLCCQLFSSASSSLSGFHVQHLFRQIPFDLHNRKAKGAVGQTIQSPFQHKHIFMLPPHPSPTFSPSQSSSIWQFFIIIYLLCYYLIYVICRLCFMLFLCFSMLSLFDFQQHFCSSSPKIVKICKCFMFKGQF